LRVPLWTRLKNGQSVEILTAEGQTPQATWLDIAVTGRAKAAIRRNLREVDRERYIKLGRELARVAFEQIGKKATDKALTTAAKMLNLARATRFWRASAPPNCRRARSSPRSTPRSGMTKTRARSRRAAP
jgi:(p)ppGpp synthase/HD superfamily hydrolase